jgi:hypothetical protein
MPKKWGKEGAWDGLIHLAVIQQKIKWNKEVLLPRHKDERYRHKIWAHTSIKKLKEK